MTGGDTQAGAQAQAQAQALARCSTRSNPATITGRQLNGDSPLRDP